MHHLPPKNSPLRACFNVEQLVAIATRREAAPTLQDARLSARKTFRSDLGASMKRVYFIALEADDRLSLISVGRRGGWRREWTFGHGLTGSEKS